ncbi:Methyltransferase-like protein-like protein [Emericellopsis cladophorae]|uniref:Methyltransferase-like protein-like protein n=1 Tax=Emericellopsis cladophorae TaxID=2686198 RepID=A0A9P9Y806_9HYPO|nr:Methyltransferase-like protein-like protein [Emericellopsis cladophorae]KAI6785217.1 Methyltransferase-like protein-like protein [Emericellopsis cladophorae]
MERSSILYQSDDGSILVLDIPRSLEESQTLPGQIPLSRRLISAQPITEPYVTPEPKRVRGGHATLAGAQNKSPAAQIADLMTGAVAQDALDYCSHHFHAEYCLPRLLEGPPVAGEIFTPAGARSLHGSLQELSDHVREDAPVFDLIMMDPPWPNRSVRRKTDNYSTVYRLEDMQHLLHHIPVPSHLSHSGLVAVWITNKSSILDFVKELLASWRLEQVAEWTWLKVTASGEPIYPINSEWRKPWEKLVIAKRVGAATPAGLQPKTIIAVPDLHSRKPNLQRLFADILPPQYRGLEVFARNLTAGWWSWGDDVLKFQQNVHWSSPDDADRP